MAIKTPSAVRALLTVAAIGLALVAQQVAVRSPRDLSSWAPFGAAAVLWLVAMWRRQPLVDAEADVASKPGRTWPRLLWAAVTVLALASTTALSAANSQPVLTLALWAAGFVAGSLALRGWVVSPPARRLVPWSRREVVVLGVILVIAVAARVAWIDSLPYYYFDDESRVGMFLRGMYDRHIPNFFTMGWNTWPMIGLSLQGLFGPLFGLSTTTLRLSSALVGTLAVAATYLLARHLFTPRVALLAALLLAICRTAIDFSRLGVCHAQVMCLIPFAFACWWRGVNTGRAISYLWTGIALGLCLYTYNAGQLAPLLWLGWVGIAAATAPRRIRTHWKGAMLTMAGFVLATLPWLFYVTDHFRFGPNWEQWTIMARNRQTLSQMLAAWQSGGFAPAVAVLRRQASITWLGFTAIPAGAYQLGYRGGGMLDHVTAPLFVLGLVASLMPRWRRGRFVAYWWVVTTIMGGILTADPPAVVRLVGILPALALLAALPLEWLLQTADAMRWGAIGRTLAALLLAAAAWNNWQTYFIAFPREFLDLKSELARQVQRLPGDRSVFLLGSEYAWHAEGWHQNQLAFNQELFALNFPAGHLLDVAEPTHFLPLHQPFDVPPVLILGPTQVLLTDYIRGLYPHTQINDNTWAGLTFRVLHLDPTDIAALTRLRLTAYDGDTATAVTIADPFAAPPQALAAQRLVWEGRIYWPTDRPAQLRAETNASIEIHLAGVSVLTSNGSPTASAAVQLPRGWQPIVIDQQVVDEHVIDQRRLSLSIEAPGLSQRVTRWDLRPDATPEGLTAVYERNGQPILRTIDPQLNSYADERLFSGSNDQPIRMPFTATWQGALRITRAGSHEFEVHATGPFDVVVDGETLMAATQVLSQDPRIERGARSLSVGEHALTARWDCTKCSNQWRRVFQLYWTPPGGQKTLVPPTSFSPALPASVPQ